MVQGRPMQLVKVDPDGRLIFYREVLETLVALCGDFPLAIYTVAGEYRKGKTTILNLFLAFNHFRELNDDWKRHKVVPLTGFEARGGSIKVTNGIWVWSKPFFSKDRSGKNVAIILMDTQGTFDQDTSSAVNSFIFGFSLAVSSILMYNNMKQISSHDVDSLITFGTTFIPIIGKFQILSFLVRDWDDEERYPYGWRGGDMMINDLVNPRGNVDRQIGQARRNIRTMFDNVTGFMLPPPGEKVARAKRDALVIGDLNSQFEQYVDELCQEIFVRNVKPFTHKGQEMNGDDWMTIFDHLIKAYDEGKVMDPGFHHGAFTGSSAKTIKDEIVTNYQKDVTEAIVDETRRTGLPYVTEEFLSGTDSRIRRRAMTLFREKTAHFGKQDAIEAQMMRESSTWHDDRRQENARAMADHKKIVESKNMLAAEQKKHESERKELANQMDQLKRDSKAQVEQAMRVSREEGERVRRECDAREAMMAQRMQENNANLNNCIQRMEGERTKERAVIQQQQEQINALKERNNSAGQSKSDPGEAIFNTALNGFFYLFKKVVDKKFQ